MTSISLQMIRKSQKDAQLTRTKKVFNLERTISTGSTLLDLAIAGGRTREGGLPGGMLVEIFGPSQTGKTVLLCEIAGDIQRKGGAIKFSDPEARLNKQFAKLFDLDIDTIEYDRPNTVPEVFAPIHTWEPKGEKGVIHGLVADSLAALSTDLEMEKEDGDKMGMRRAKEFSEQLRKAARVIASKNLLVVCSNQVRENADAGPYGAKYSTPGGLAVGFYASTRLRMMGSEKLYKETTFKGKKVKKVVGIKTMVEVFKNSVWESFHQAPVYIQFDYGIDDVRANLQYIKDYSGKSFYSLGETKLSNEMAEAISLIEENEWEGQLKEQVIDLWNSIEKKMATTRKPKQR
jgi:protein RecA